MKINIEYTSTYISHYLELNQEQEREIIQSVPKYLAVGNNIMIFWGAGGWEMELA